MLLKGMRRRKQVPVDGARVRELKNRGPKVSSARELHFDLGQISCSLYSPVSSAVK